MLPAGSGGEWGRAQVAWSPHWPAHHTPPTELWGAVAAVGTRMCGPQPSSRAVCPQAALSGVPRLSHVWAWGEWGQGTGVLLTRHLRRLDRSRPARLRQGPCWQGPWTPDAHRPAQWKAMGGPTAAASFLSCTRTLLPPELPGGAQHQCVWGSPTSAPGVGPAPVCLGQPLLCVCCPRSLGHVRGWA